MNIGKAALALGALGASGGMSWGGPSVHSDKYGNRSKYKKPHQGPKECARRVRQMAKELTQGESV